MPYRTIGEEFVEMLERLVQEAQKERLRREKRKRIDVSTAVPRMTWDLQTLRSHGIVKNSTAVTIDVDPVKRTVSVVVSSGGDTASCTISEVSLVACSRPGASLLKAVQKADARLGRKKAA